MERRKTIDATVPYCPITGDLMHYAHEDETVIGYKGPDGVTRTWEGHRKVFPGGSEDYVPSQILVEWRSNEPFEGAMTIVGVYSGRSARGAIWVDGTGRKFPMFAKDLPSTLLSSTCMRGTITARWQVRRQGANYGLVLAR